MTKSQKSSADLKKIEQKQERQQKTIQKLEKKERFMKWLAVGVLILILLALLTAGYATDWTRGLKKNASLGNQVEGGLEAAGQPVSKTDSSTNTTGTTAKETSTSTTTNNSSTTTDNNDTTTDPNKNLIDSLISLYNDTSVGGNVDDLIARAQALGIDVNCGNELLIQNCTFTAAGESIATKNILGTGTITSLLDNISL